MSTHCLAVFVRNVVCNSLSVRHANSAALNQLCFVAGGGGDARGGAQFQRTRVRPPARPVRASRVPAVCWSFPGGHCDRRATRQSASARTLESCSLRLPAHQRVARRSLPRTVCTARAARDGRVQPLPNRRARRKLCQVSYNVLFILVVSIQLL